MTENKMVEILGQSLVLTKLALEGFVASLAPENAKDIDIQAYHMESEEPILVQVKTKGPKSKVWQLNAKTFLDIVVSKQPDGRYKQEIRGVWPTKQHVLYVFVELTEQKCTACMQELDNMYICKQEQVGKIVKKEYSEYINSSNPRTGKRRGYRLKGGESTHMSFEKRWVEGWTDWSILKE